MKRFLILLSLLFCGDVFAATETINWYVDGTSYATTTCQTGGDIILPTTPTKYGYTFQGWNDYTPIEYLESTGTQYIDTGIRVNSKYTVEVKGVFVCGAPLFGEKGTAFRGGTTNGFMLGIACSSGNSCWGQGYASSLMNEIGISSSEVSILKIDKNGIYKNGIKTLNFNQNDTTVYSSQSFLLFATTGEYGWSSNDSFYYVKIWDDNNTLVRDFIPVFDVNGTPCMYDKVTQQFFYNQGTGNFIAGPIVQ